MKLKYLWMATIALFGMVACSENDSAEEISKELVNTYLTVQVEGPSVRAMRTLPDGANVEAGTPEEGKISNLMVLLYDASNVVKKVYVTDQMKNTPDGAQTSIFPVAPGKYQVYVIANFSEREKPWENLPGLNVKELTIDDISENLMKNSYAAPQHFLMFNESNGTDDVAGVPVEITAANTQKNPASCTVSLDRLALKIQSQVGQLDIQGVTDDLGPEGFANLSVKLKGFKLMNGATQAYLQQRWTHAKPTVYPYKNQLITPWLFLDGEPPVFGYYNRLTDFRTVIYDAENHYEVVRDNYADLPFYGASATAPIYCMENNPTWNGTSVVDALRGNTTALIYQFLLAYDGSDNLAGTSCFYAYGRRFFPSLQAIQEAYPDAFADATASPSAEVDLKAAQDELTAAYLSPDIYSGVSEFRAKYGIKVYMDGLMYYIYYIQDMNYVEGDSNYFAVMRNSIYDLTVNKLLRVGDDIPGGWNPDTKPVDPVVPTNTYMNVFVKVNPWVLNKQEIDLK